MQPAEQVSERTPPHRWKPIEDLPADPTPLTRAVAEVAAIRRAWATKKSELAAELLRGRAAVRFDEVVRRVASTIRDIPGGTASATSSRPSNEGLYDDAILAAAQVLGYPAELTGPHPWLELEINHGRRTSLFLSFHRVGAIDSSVMAASALVLSFNADGRVARGEPCCTEPFTFTEQRDRDEMASAFDAWLDRSITAGLAVWRRSL